MNDYKAGDFGHFQFVHWPAGFAVTLDFYGTIVKVYPGLLLIEDNEGHPFLVMKQDLKFESAERPSGNC